MNNISSSRLGKGGECICPKCKTTVKHERGVPCQDTKCPECGTKMLRKESEHYNKWMDKQK